MAYPPGDEDLEAASAPSAPAEKEEGDDEGETFLAPKSAFYGKELKPGTRKTVEIVATYDDEVELRCRKKSKDDDSDDDSDEESPSPPSPMGAEMMEADA